jgi:hypothetical protein
MRVTSAVLATMWTHWKPLRGLQTLANSVWKRHWATDFLFRASTTHLTQASKLHALVGFPGAFGMSTRGSQAVFSLLCEGSESSTERSGRVTNPGALHVEVFPGQSFRHASFLHTPHARKCLEESHCDTCIVYAMLPWPSPAHLGRRHVAHTRSSDPCAEAPEVSRSVQGGSQAHANNLWKRRWAIYVAIRVRGPGRGVTRRGR